ncbi:MAG: alpha/beta hydrolase, partial [Pseudomonadota bacterium]
QLRLADLGRLTCPVLLIRGARSEPIVPAIHGAIQGAVPHASERVIAGAAHMAPITHPQAVADEISAWQAAY